MNRTSTNTLSAVPVQFIVFAVTAMLLFWAAFFYPTSASAAESQTLAANQTLAAGASEWISFDYSGDSEKIELWIDSANDDMTFAVWTAERLAADEDEREPIGRGSEDEYTPGDSYWTGEFVEARTLYVEVQNNTGAPDTYSLYIASDGVTLPLRPLSETFTETGNAGNGGGGAESESSLGTESAVPTVGEWQVVEPGETVWFTVGYGGDSEKIEVWAETDSNDVAFAIYTTAQYANDEEPVGRGSADDNTPGDLYWTGEFTRPDTLHIAVTNNGTTTHYYNLHISQ